MALLGASLLGCESEDLPPPTTNESVPVKFDVTVPADTPCGAIVAIVGNDPALGNGKPPGLALTRDVDGHFRGSAMFPVRKVLNYNIVLTNPSAQEPIAFHNYTVEARKDIERRWTVSRWSLAADPSQTPISFVVDVPANTPANAEIWLSGNQPELGNWNGAGVKLAKSLSGGSRYGTCVAFATDTHLEFKVTRGSWDFVEKDPRGREVDNHLHTVAAPAKVEVQVGSWRDLGPVEPEPDTLTGNIKYHDADGSSVGLKSRKLIVWLPPNYDAQTSTSYPVLYMHDGQNLMNAKTAAFGVEWGVDETAQQLTEAGQMEPIIIVGVYNTDDRIPEYTQVSTPQYGGGKADDYGRLLVEVVKPLIDMTYRTKPDARYTGVAGSSLGGLVSMYFGITRSSTFTRLGVVSPSVWWAERDIVTRVNNLGEKPPLRIWLDIGTNEDGSVAESQQTVEDTRMLRDALAAKGWVLNTDLKYLEAEGARHNEAAWAARSDQILKFLYPPVP
ncbi:alpha/beta hydrolase-fold protein [Hyalangium sp.]|uniref:alpha/beta hydrolase-fold protein n=1 Tax=Hyalangium sp. TaxID=2028555 RepID=UPI002D530B76|nr:alpha/beta hydrolase-fold protein [Hyalangium sp.]HYH97844.1 alpha/beta hydrolase-fold protein [Hyalangium sp.]